MQICLQGDLLGQKAANCHSVRETVSQNMQQRFIITY